VVLKKSLFVGNLNVLSTSSLDWVRLSGTYNETFHRSLFMISAS
jgi:hypothetical protein